MFLFGASPKQIKTIELAVSPKIWKSTQDFSVFGIFQEKEDTCVVGREKDRATKNDG